MTRAARPRAGFTMLEMMMVLAIISILAALAIVNLTSLNGTAKSNGEAEVIAQMIRVTRMQALSTGCGHVFRYRGLEYSGSDKGTLTVYRKKTASCVLGAPADLVFSAGDLVVNTHQLSLGMVVAAGVDLKDQSVELGFNANGTTVSGTDGSARALVPFVVKSLQNDRYTRTVAFLGGSNVTLQ